MKKSKRAIKKSEELKGILDEAGIPSSKKENHSKGESAKPIPVTNKKPKSFNENIRKNFVESVKKRLNLKNKIDDIQNELVKNEELLTELTKKYGKNLITDPRDLILYAQPYMTHLCWNDRGGSIDTEKVVEAYPELADPGTKTLDLTKLEKVINEFDLPPGVATYFKKLEKIVEQVEAVTGQKVTEKTDLGLLDMEKYRDYKEEGKITPEEVAEFEQKDGNYSFKSYKLTDKPRCSCCGFPRSKRNIESKKHTCTRCGHSE